jgi:hypothetical protein
MTGGQFQNLISSTRCFSPDYDQTIVFTNRNGKPIHVTSKWNRVNNGFDRLSICLSYHTDRSVWVDFSIGNNLYATHNLKYLDFNLFAIEVDKVLKRNSNWENWIKINRRDYLIKEVLK